MRNLKKILAMVLALIMSLSLMATAGATDFKDDEKVASSTYRQAIEVLSGLGVFNGDQNNNFNPDDEITRAEVAAIIYRITTGDVENVRADSYSLYNQFSDVEVGSWYEGYVSYCHNAGYVKGHGDGTFKPNDKISGYQALAMILRAVGYDTPGHELFIGDSWEVNTASIATQRGVLKNINNTTSAVSLRENANRALVAEILFQSFLLNKVEWNIVSGTYTPIEEKVCDVLNVEDIEGVVMANKWADLENDTVLKDGLTRLDVDGKDYVLEIDTPITAIGEMRHAYVQNGTKVIGNLTEGDLEDLGTSAVAEPENNGGKGAKVATIAKEGNIKLTNDTEYFVNFGEGEYYTSEWQIRYTVEFGNAVAKNLFAERYANVDDAVKYDEERDIDADDMLIDVNGENGNHLKYEKVIRAGMEITGYDLLIMQGIFNSAAQSSTTSADNKVEGAVYVGTVKNGNTSVGNNSVTSAQIVSNDRSWNQFFNEFIDNNATNYTQSDNGEWLKIVDKDGDGNADYVLRTDFVMTTVIDYNKESDAYILEYIDPVSAKHIEMPKDEINFVTEGLESLVEGDVILYTYIDGVYHVSIPNVEAKATFTKADYKANEATFTIGEEKDVVKEWSGIDNKAAYYRNDITSLGGGSYTLYYDHFGYVRLYKESTKDFVLLNNAYYNTNLRVDEFKAEIFNPETGKLEEVNANDHVWAGVRDENTGIINTTEDKVTGDHGDTGHGNRGTWNRLNTFGFYNYEVFQNDNIISTRHYRYEDDVPYDNHPYAGYFRSVFATNVAAYDVDADGTYNLYDVMAANTYGDKSDVLYNAYTLVTNTAPDAAIDVATGLSVNATAATATARTLWGIVDWTRTGTGAANDPYGYNATEVQRIHATASTRYYWVLKGGNTNAEIVTWTGFSAPSGFNWDAKINNAYVVTSTVEVDEKRTAYETAEVVVFEGSYVEAPNYQSGAIAAQGNVPSTNKNDKDSVRAAEEIVSPTVLYMMGWNGSTWTTDIQNKCTDSHGDSLYPDGGMLRFYGLGKDGYTLVSDNYYNWNFYAGYVVTERDTDNKVDSRYGYLNKAWDIDITAVDGQLEIPNGQPKAYWHGNESFYDPDTVQVYRFTKVTDTYGRVGYDWTSSTINYNDKVLYITDENGQAQMIFNITESIKAAGKGSEIEAKLIDTENVPYAGLWGLWNDVQDDYEEDCVTNAGQATVKVITKDNAIDSVLTSDIATQIQKSAGNMIVTLPAATDFTGTGWNWTAPSAGETQANDDHIVITNNATGKAMNWVALSATQIQLQGVTLGGSYTVELQVSSGSANTIDVTGISAADKFELLSTGADQLSLSAGQSGWLYYAVSSKCLVTLTAPDASITLGTPIAVAEADLPEDMAATGAVEAGATWKYFKVLVSSTETSSGTKSLTGVLTTGYSVTVNPDSTFATDNSTTATLPVGTKLSEVEIKVTVTDGYELSWSTNIDAAAATNTIVKMGTERVAIASVVADTTPGNFIIKLAGTGDVTGNIVVDLKAKAAPADTSDLEDYLKDQYADEIKLTDVDATPSSTDYDFAISATGESGTYEFTMTTAANQVVDKNGNANITVSETPFRAGEKTWYIRVDAAAMREAETLTFTLTITDAPVPSAAGTIALTTPGKANTPAAAVSGSPSLTADKTTTGDTTDKEVYTVSLANVSFTTYGNTKFTVNGTEYTFISAADTWIASLAAELDGKIADGLGSGEGKYKVTASGTDLIFTASDVTAVGSTVTAISTVAIANADSAAADGTEAVYTITITSVGEVAGDVLVKLGAQEWTVAVTEGMTAAQFAAALKTAMTNTAVTADATAGAWTAANVEATVTLTAANAAAVTTALSGLTFEAAPEVVEP